jgi:hypothetical protein
MKLTSIKAEPHEIYLVIKSGIKIYPVNIKGNWFIEANNNGKITRFNKSVSHAELNDSIAKTTKYYYKLLTAKDEKK